MSGDSTKLQIYQPQGTISELKKAALNSDLKKRSDLEARSDTKLIPGALALLMKPVNLVQNFTQETRNYYNFFETLNQREELI